MTALATRSETTQWGPADAPQLDRLYAGRAMEALHDVLHDPAFGKVALVSSFGADSAVLLHLAAQIRRDVPVLFVNTGWLFPETLSYAEDLSAHLRLTDVRWLRPDSAVIDAKDPKHLRWSYDPDGCCDIRKVEPMKRAKDGLDAWISGRKAFQSVTRQNLPRF